MKRNAIAFVVRLALVAFLSTVPVPSVVAQVQPPKLQPLNTHYQSALADLRKGNTDKANLEVKLALQDNPLDAGSHFLFG